jgi:hypothetical protein
MASAINPFSLLEERPSQLQAKLQLRMTRAAAEVIWRR